MELFWEEYLHKRYDGTRAQGNAIKKSQKRGKWEYKNGTKTKYWKKVCLSNQKLKYPPLSGYWNKSVIKSIPKMSLNLHKND